jgi:hypothetical protein
MVFLCIKNLEVTITRTVLASRHPAKPIYIVEHCCLLGEENIQMRKKKNDLQAIVKNCTYQRGA